MRWPTATPTFEYWCSQIYLGWFTDSVKSFDENFATL